ncbi:MAG: AefR-like transcriptional repressor, C-terminal domain, partial [Acidobacteriaceae bacterium]|nr:AefR-like transcriptional repressor, C-terminal domain [Acidobacteriaceae bacterium]
VRAMLADYLGAQQKLGAIRCGNPEQAVEVFLGLLVSAATLRASLGLPPTYAKTQAQRKSWANFAVDMFLSSMQINASR